MKARRFLVVVVNGCWEIAGWIKVRRNGKYKIVHIYHIENTKNTLNCDSVNRMEALPFFDDRFDCTVETQPVLPFFHTCDAYYLQKILETRRLTPRECKVFNNEELLYLFYGRPAYKSSEVCNSRLGCNMPVCFILNPNCVSTIKRVLPFDSGAFNLYKSFMHKGMTIDDFLMKNEIRSIQKTVNYFFDGNTKYYEGLVKQEIYYDPIHFQVESYHKLISDGGRQIQDDRKASIEIQLDCAIELTKDTVEALILPLPLIASPLVKSAADELDAEIIPLSNYGVASTHYYVHLLELTKSYLTKKHLLNGN